MNKAKPADLHKTMVLCNELVKAGINFVPMPILDHNEDLKGLVEQMNERFDKFMLMVGGKDGGDK